MTGGRPEFSRPVPVDGLGDGGTVVEIEAGAEERKALARRLGVLSVDRLDATLRLVRRRDGTCVRLVGDLRARMTQACVVTLKALSTDIKAAVDRLFGPDAPGAAEDEVMVSLDDADPPEAIVDGVIDVGEVVAEQLSLEIDPFPRAAGAVFDGYSSAPAAAGGGAADGPFEALSGLKRK